MKKIITWLMVLLILANYFLLLSKNLAKKASADNFKVYPLTGLVAKDTSGIFQAKKGEVELIGQRTENFKKFALGNGKYRVAGQIGPIHYKNNPFDDNEPYKEIDLTIHETPDRDYDFAMEQNGYQVYIWHQREANGSRQNLVAQFRRAGKWLEMAPVELIYENDAGEEQVISQVRQSSDSPIIDNDAYHITWKNVFGEGIDFRYNINTEEFFKTVVVNKKENLPAPAIGQKGLKLTVIMAFSWDQQAKIDENFAKGVKTQLPSITEAKARQSDPDETLSNPQGLSYKDSKNREIWWLKQPKAWDSSKEPKNFEMGWKLTRQGNNVFAFLGLPFSTLNSQLSYPLFLDTSIPEHQVAASYDDGYEGGVNWPGYGGDVDLTGIALGVGALTDNFYSLGARFLTIPIPAGATIDSASVSVKAFSDWETPLNLDIYADDHDSAATFAVSTDTATGSPGYRTRTTNSANWNVGTSAWTAATWYTTSDLTSPVQEVISRAGWVVNGDLAFIMVNHSQSLPEETSYRTAYSYDQGTHISGPKFNAAYTEGANPNMILMWDGAGDAPAGWSYVSNNPGDMYGVFPRGEASYSASAGGAADHTHSGSAAANSSTPTGSTIGNTGATAASTSTHTHAVTGTPSLTSISNLPAYRNLRFIKYSGIPTGSSAIPSGAIAIFDSTVADTMPNADWDSYSGTQGTNYLRGDATAGGTGGSNSHAGTGHTVSGPTLGTVTGTTVAGGTSPSATSDVHTHTACSTQNTTDTPSSEPPYVNVLLGKTNTATSIPDKMLAMFDGTDFISYGWEILSNNGGPFYQKFLKSATTYSAGGGADPTHSHAGVTCKSASGGGDVNSQGTGTGIQAHTHTTAVTIGAATATTLPPYTNVVIAKYSYRITAVTDAGSYPTLGLTITVDATAYNNSNTNLTSTKIDYVIFIDTDADGVPDVGETYMYTTSTACDTSGAWAVNGYTFQKTGLNVNSGSSGADEQSCSNSSFPQNTTYTLYGKWYNSDGTIIYNYSSSTFTSVPTLGSVMLMVFIGLAVFSGIYEARKSLKLKKQKAKNG